MSNLESLPDPLVQQLMDYVMSGTAARGRYGHCIPAIVSQEWIEQGYAVLRTNTLAKQYGIGRKTMWKTIRACIDDGFIREIGRTDEGRAMYAPCLERGTAWRAAREARLNG